MTDDELKSKLAAAREFEYRAGERVSIRLAIPSQDAIRRIYARHPSDVRLNEGMADTLTASLRGIRGATLADLGLAGEDALPDSALSAREYVAEHPALADELAYELFRRARERFDRIEQDRKN